MSYNSFPGMHFFLISLFSFLYSVPYLDIFFCLLYILSRISYAIQTFCSFFSDKAHTRVYFADVILSFNYDEIPNPIYAVESRDTLTQYFYMARDESINNLAFSIYQSLTAIFVCYITFFFF